MRKKGSHQEEGGVGVGRMAKNGQGGHHCCGAGVVIRPRGIHQILIQPGPTTSIIPLVAVILCRVVGRPRRPKGEGLPLCVQRLPGRDERVEG